MQSAETQTQTQAHDAVTHGYLLVDLIDGSTYGWAKQAGAAIGLLDVARAERIAPDSTCLMRAQDFDGSLTSVQVLMWTAAYHAPLDAPLDTPAQVADAMTAYTLGARNGNA